MSAFLGFDSLIFLAMGIQQFNLSGMISRLGEFLSGLEMLEFELI